MSKKAIAILMGLVAAVALVGCGDPPPDKDATVNPTADAPVTNPANNAGTKNTEGQNVKNAMTDIGVQESAK